MKKVAILQSNYIPWKGYFDLINMVDEFIIYDDMQYTRRDWRNRNLIKTPTGLMWLSIPVEVKGKYLQTINETIISDAGWAKKHWATIQQFYAKANYFKEYKDVFEMFYISCNEKYLSEVNKKMISLINALLGIKTQITSSSDYMLVDGKTERLIGLVKQARGNEYISGPAAKDYIVEELFTNEDIKLSWINYSGYTEYRQQFAPFVHGVSIIDLIFNEGPEAVKYLKSFSNGK